MDPSAALSGTRPTDTFLIETRTWPRVWVLAAVPATVVVAVAVAVGTAVRSVDVETAGPGVAGGGSQAGGRARTRSPRRRWGGGMRSAGWDYRPVILADGCQPPVGVG